MPDEFEGKGYILSIYYCISFQINENEKTTAKKLLLNVINDRRYAVIVDQFDTFINIFLINFDNIRCKNELGIDR